MSATFSAGYKLAWLPRLITAGMGGMGSFPAAPLKHNPAAGNPATSKRIVFLGDLSAVGNRQKPEFCEAFRRLCGAADAIVANCESPIVARSIMPLQTRLGFCHAMTERFLAEVLDAAAIRPERLILSLANNHIADQGRAGLDRTIAILRELKIVTVGLRSGLATVWERVCVGGTEIAVLAFTQWLDRDLLLLREKVRYGAPNDDEPPPEDAGLACVLPHWGGEFRYRPDEEMRKLAGRLAGLGADVIAGTHPHVIQPLERAGAGLIAYSLGDFLGSVLARAPWRVRLSMALAVDFNPELPRGARIAFYEAHPFFRMALEGRERIEAIDALPDGLRQPVEKFAARVLGSLEEAPAAEIPADIVPDVAPLTP